MLILSQYIKTLDEVAVYDAWYGQMMRAADDLSDWAESGDGQDWLVFVRRHTTAVTLRDELISRLRLEGDLSATPVD